jgi:hypothetical protein
MKAEEFLKEKSDWFDKSPGGEKLYFESEVIRMMNEYANEALSIHAVNGRSEQLVAFLKWVGDGYDFENNAEKIVNDYISEGN